MQQRPRIEREEFRREPRTTGEARRAITETRNRISQDLDAIEDQIVEKRDEWRSKLDVLTPARRRVRNNPWPSLGLALGTGLALGMIGGGDDEAESKAEQDRHRRRRQRAERRERMKHMKQRQQRRRPTDQGRAPRAGGGVGRSKTGMLSGAVASGLTTRMKRVGRQLLLGRR